MRHPPLAPRRKPYVRANIWSSGLSETRWLKPPGNKKISRTWIPRTKKLVFSPKLCCPESRQKNRGWTPAKSLRNWQLTAKLWVGMMMIMYCEAHRLHTQCRSFVHLLSIVDRLRAVVKIWIESHPLQNGIDIGKKICKKEMSKDLISLLAREMWVKKII